MVSSLQSVRKGQKIRLLRCTEPVLSARLAEVGMVPGSLWEVLRSLPFSGPLVLSDGAMQIGIRKRDARVIEIETL